MKKKDPSAQDQTASKPDLEVDSLEPRVLMPATQCGQDVDYDAQDCDDGGSNVDYDVVGDSCGGGPCGGKPDILDGYGDGGCGGKTVPMYDVGGQNHFDVKIDDYDDGSSDHDNCEVNDEHVADSHDKGWQSDGIHDKGW